MHKSFIDASKHGSLGCWVLVFRHLSIVETKKEAQRRACTDARGEIGGCWLIPPAIDVSYLGISVKTCC